MTRLPRATSLPVLIFISSVFLVSGCSSASKQRKTPDVKADRQHQAGIKAYKRYDYAQALQLFQEALNEYRLTDRRSKVALVSGNMAVILHKLNRHEKAYTAANQSIEIFDKLNSQDSLAGAYLDRSSIAIELDKLRQAEEDLSKVTELINVSAEKSFQIRYKLSRANLQLGRGDLKESEDTVKETLRIISESSSDSFKSSAFMLLSQIKQSEGNARESITYAKKALRLDRKRGDPVAILEDLTQLTTLHGNTGKIQQANNYRRRALPIARQLEMKTIVDQLNSYRN